MEKYSNLPCGRFVPRNGHARTLTVSYKGHCPNGDAVPHNQGREREDKGMVFYKLHYISYLRNL